MQDIMLLDWNLASALRYQSPYLPKPALPVHVTLTVPNEIVQIISNDPLLHQQMVDACRLRLLEAVTKIDKVREETDKLIKKDMDAFFEENKHKVRILRMLKQNVPLPDFAETYQEFLTKFNKFEIDHALYNAQIAAQHQWETLAEQHKEYKKYKKDVVVKVALGATGLGLAGAGLALAIPTGGASLALAVVVAWRSLVDGLKVLAALIKEAETVGKETRKLLESLKNRYDNKIKGNVAVQEVAASVINSLLQTEVGNISKAKSKNELWKQKLAGIRTRAHSLSIQLNELLVKQDALTDLLLAMELQIEEFAIYYGRNHKNVRKKLEKLRKAVSQKNTLILKVKQILDSNKIPTFHLRAEDGLKAQQLAAQALAELENKSPGWTQKFDSYFALLVNVGLAAAGDTVGFVGAKTVVDWALTGATAANDLATNIKDLCEAIG
ncbi:MAG: hypothetical protein KDJ22_15260 [Candidatus Competibacteraceae bacterium]|nr:hypothetical protein [Candidatus Competibacteraceae bacterium]MCP5124438.1 hypothetical protein [Gammaproteobacteria bacterium]MCP5307172.1 hypothetical protein [Chromatiaceae bacterium]